MVNEVISLSDLAAARAGIYKLTSALYFRTHETYLLKSLEEWVSSQTATDNSSQLLSKQMRHGLTAMDSFFREVKGKSWEELLETVSVEFTRLFRGVKKHYSPPPPYESVYREEGGRVFGELTVAVRSEYRRFGLDLANELSGEPPDHISFEMEFMHLLCSREVTAWKRNDMDEALRFLKAEKEFSEEHLLTWIPGLCDKVREFDRIDFFRGLADLTEGWITFDYQQHLNGN